MAKILFKLESYDQVKNLQLQPGKIVQSSGKTYQIFSEKLTPGKSVLLGVKALFLMIFTLFSQDAKNMWSQARAGRITHYVDYDSLPRELKKTNQFASNRLSTPSAKLIDNEKDTVKPKSELDIKNTKQVEPAPNIDEQKVVTSRADNYEIQTRMTRYKDELFCNSKIANALNCEFNVILEDDGVTVNMTKIDLEQKFENEELKAILKSALKSILDSVDVKNRSIKAIHLSNSRGEQNLQLYNLGFQLDPKSVGYNYEGQIFTTQTIKESLENGKNTYQGKLNMLASGDLIKFISSEVEVVPEELVQAKEERKNITSTSGKYEIQTNVTEASNALVCSSKISDHEQKIFDCEFKIKFEDNQAMIDISKIDLEQKFENEELKGILKSTLKSVLRPDVAIKEIKLENERGEQNIQLYNMGFQISPNLMGNIYKNNFYSRTQIQEYFDSGVDAYQQIYQGPLDMVASDDLVKFISSDV